MTNRITWEKGEHACRYGKVGGVSLFTIAWKTVRNDPDWTLRADLPGVGIRHAKDDDEDTLKATAEAWLRRWAVLLGNPYPEDRETTLYWGIAEIGALFGVQGHTVDRWRRRYGPDRTEEQLAKTPPFPEPDIVLGVRRPNAGWLPERETEIRDWKATMPGPGAGGGRPRRQGTGQASAASG